jgi:amidase
MGSKSCSTAVDDPLVAKFREAGAIILGLTVSTEGGITPLGYSFWFDGPFNPYNTAYYSGGSS